MLGKLSVPDALLTRIEDAGIRSAAHGVAAAEELTCWTALVRHDPFDRLLLARAIVGGAMLLTADRMLLGSENAPVLDGRV